MLKHKNTLNKIAADFPTGSTAIGAGTGAVATLLARKLMGGDMSWKDYLLWGALGATGGGVLGALAGGVGSEVEDVKKSPTAADSKATASTNTEPTNTEPTNTEPTNTESTNTEPTNTEPTNTESTNTESTTANKSTDASKPKPKSAQKMLAEKLLDYESLFTEGPAQLRKEIKESGVPNFLMWHIPTQLLASWRTPFSSLYYPTLGKKHIGTPKSVFGLPLPHIDKDIPWIRLKEKQLLKDPALRAGWWNLDDYMNAQNADIKNQRTQLEIEERVTKAELEAANSSNKAKREAIGKDIKTIEGKIKAEKKGISVEDSPRYKRLKAVIAALEEQLNDSSYDPAVRKQLEGELAKAKAALSKADAELLDAQGRLRAYDAKIDPKAARLSDIQVKLNEAGKEFAAAVESGDTAKISAARDKYIKASDKVVDSVRSDDRLLTNNGGVFTTNDLTAPKDAIELYKVIESKVRGVRKPRSPFEIAAFEALDRLRPLVSTGEYKGEAAPKGLVELADRYSKHRVDREALEADVTVKTQSKADAQTAVDDAAILRNNAVADPKDVRKKLAATTANLSQLEREFERILSDIDAGKGLPQGKSFGPDLDERLSSLLSLSEELAKLRASDKALINDPNISKLRGKLSDILKKMADLDSELSRRTTNSTLTVRQPKGDKGVYTRTTRGKIKRILYNLGVFGAVEGARQWAKPNDDGKHRGY